MSSSVGGWDDIENAAGFTLARAVKATEDNAHELQDIITDRTHSIETVCHFTIPNPT